MSDRDVTSVNVRYAYESDAGKAFLVAAPLLGGLLTLFVDFLFGVATSYRYAPVFLWLPLIFAPLAAALVFFQQQFSRSAALAACVFLAAAPVFVGSGGPLHGGEIILICHAALGIAATVFAAVGLLLCHRGQ